ncbi:uncharacterized protein N7503_012151 [Penicillium pulvis]|uniref:uncharacterized protein n=1 Tax=Penicillium pulvis TaxID=1562058 RepID=UPI0025474AA5|nr:uncharacterized protein N7503_012151 [Penicillium pulvis]KAJ5786939.1 hypothetical protein N7503_012151 [Penicillium pulvis]
MGSITPPRAVEALPATSASEKILEILYRDGAVVIKNLLSLDSVAEITGEIKPYMDADYNSGLEVFAKQTKTVCGLAGKSPAAVKSILQNPNVKTIVNDVLSVTTESWWGDARNKCVSPPLLSSFFTVRVGPGSARQGLHRDDQDHHATHTHGDPKETTKLGCFVATSKVTKENGATEIVLGSHVWDDVRKPSVDEVSYGEMDTGDALLMLGNCYHGAGANVTSDSFRSVVVTLFCKGVYRSEENQFLAVTQEQAKNLDPEVQDLLGWKASAPFCGWYDLGHPYRLIREVDNVGSDLF